MVRRTISVTEDLDRRIREIAASKGRSYSAIVADLIEQRLDDPLPYEGAGAGPRDLARNAERYLDRQAAERKR
jgi:hypothetical protein